MYKKNMAFTILIIIMVISISCGCISDGSDSKKVLTENPLELEHVETKVILDGVWQESTTTYVRADYPVQKEDYMYMDMDPPHRQISIDFNLINTGSTTIKDVRVEVDLPDKWGIAFFIHDYYDELEPNKKTPVILSVCSEPIPRYLGLDTDGDGFADVFDPNDNELDIECYDNNGKLKYPQIFSTGLEAKEYKFKVQAWSDDIPKVSIEYTIGFEK